MSDPHVIEAARATLRGKPNEDDYSKAVLLEMIRHLVVHLDCCEEDLRSFIPEWPK